MWKIIFFLLLIGNSLYAQTDTTGWKGIVPMRSTRADVERVLGKPMEKERNTYDTKTERVTVWYSDGLCNEVAKPQWNLPKDTVVGFIVSPKNDVPLALIMSALGTRFEKAAIPEVSNRFLYLSEDGSIEIETERVDRDEEIFYIAYKPTNSDPSLKCSSGKGFYENRKVQ